MPWFLPFLFLHQRQIFFFSSKMFRFLFILNVSTISTVMSFVTATTSSPFLYSFMMYVPVLSQKTEKFAFLSTFSFCSARTAPNSGVSPSYVFDTCMMLFSRLVLSFPLLLSLLLVISPVVAFCFSCNELLELTLAVVAIPPLEFSVIVDFSL